MSEKKKLISLVKDIHSYICKEDPLCPLTLTAIVDNFAEYVASLHYTSVSCKNYNLVLDSTTLGIKAYDEAVSYLRTDKVVTDDKTKTNSKTITLQK